MSEYQLHISGMTCSACSTRIEKSLQRLEGVQLASVSLATSSATVHLQDRATNIGAVIDKIKQLGYEAEQPKQSDVDPFMAEASRWRTRFMVSFILSLPLFLVMLGHFFDPIGERLPVFLFNPTYQWTIGSILFCYSGYPFHIGAWNALRHRAPNMEVLISVSISVAYFYSLFSLLQSDSTHPSGHGSMHFYFDSIAMILSSVSLGKWMESIAKGNALRSLSALKTLHSPIARVVRSRNQEEQIPVHLVRKGDLVHVQPGEWIPVDGVIMEGIGEVDESLLTGEPMTAARREGERVYAGTRLVNGILTLTASANGMESRLSRLIAMVEKAQAMKPRIQRKADLIAAWFVPSIFVIALLTYIGWSVVSRPEEGFRNAMAVLLVACPCALGLATPISVLIGSGKAARAGIIFKEGSMLETLSRVKLFVFDKTGTVTQGKPILTRIHTRLLSTNRLLKVTASLERVSEHPLAKATVQEALSERLLLTEPKDVKEFPGEGLSGLIENRSIMVGRESWLRNRGIAFPHAFPDHLTSMDSVLHVAIEGRWEGFLTFQDKAREDAFFTIGRLSRQARIVMATGDREGAAGTIAKETGIQHVKAQLLPEQKMELIVQYQREGNVVAMVGDGMNDAAALASADVGIVMAGGNDAALQSGDIVIIGSHLSRIGDAYDIAVKTMRNIKQNLWIAFIFNSIMIPLSILGALDPRLACIGMTASSLLVVSNSLRLLRMTTVTLSRSAGA